MNLSQKNKTVQSLGDFDRPKALIVDDKASRLFELETQLSHLELTLFEAESGKQAIQLVAKHDFAVILARSEMEQMDGYQLAQELSQRPQLSGTPLIIVTETIDEERAQNLMLTSGSVDFILLPLDDVKLTTRISIFLSLFLTRRQLMREESKRKRMEEKLKRSSQLDDLTFIANRKFFKQQYIVEWRRMLREYKPFSLIMIHIDGFDTYRDAYGQQASDLCLIKIGTTIKNSLKRAADFVARIEDGGFVAVLPNTNTEGARRIGDRIIINVNTLKLEHLNSMVAKHITVSQGIGSVTTSPHIEPNELIALADQALFKAKKEGGNRFCILEFVGN